MSKDPAFLFYPSDFLTGTMFMNHEQIGIYVRLLCSQHQHGGIIDKISFNSLVQNNDLIRSKFIETETGFYNERLAEEMEKRSKKSSNMSEVAKKVWSKRKEEKNTIVLQKEKKSNTKVKEKDTFVMQPVNEDEVINYFIDNKYSKELAKKFYDHYQPDWKDSNGKVVKDWKKKARVVWFKPENQIEKKADTFRKMIL